MATLNTLRTKFESINMLELVDECIDETQDILVDLVRSQIEHGLSSTGQLPPYSSLKYAAKKQAMGSKAPSGITDLKFTGSFLSGLYLKNNPKNRVIRSSDQKNSLLIRKYGTEIMELTEENLSYYATEVIQPLLLKKIS